MARELITITGGTGFLGRHLVPCLLDEGYRLRMLVRRSSDLRWLSQNRVELVFGDVTDSRAVKGAISGADHVVHAAGHFRFWGPTDRFDRVNVSGTKQVALAALHHSVARLIHISTVAVVGQQPESGLIDEDTVCQPSDPYQRSKLAAERMVKALNTQNGLPAVILRPGAFYGPFGRYGFNRLFIEDPLRGLRVQVERGKRLTFPVFVPDVARAVVLAIRRASLGEIYNICDRPVSHAEVNRIVSELLGINAHRWNVPRPLMIALAGLMELAAKLNNREPFYPLNLRYYVFKDWQVSSAKARAILGFNPTPLKEGLRQTIRWYRRGG